MPTLPLFLNPPRSALCSSIITIACANGFDNSLAHGKHTPWFNVKQTSFFASGGILFHFKVTSALQIQRKFKEAENKVKFLCERRLHQNDTTEDDDEVALPYFATFFLNIFNSWTKEAQHKT